MGKKKAASRVVPKLGIYVPPNRIEDVAKWRDEMNFSELFWSAFDREVIRKTSLKMEGGAMQKMIERLKKESSESFERGVEAGRSEGATWAQETGTASHIRKIAVGEIRFDADNPVNGWLMKEYADWYDPNDIRENDPDFLDDDDYVSGFGKGFDEAVTEAWNQVKDQI